MSVMFNQKRIYMCVCVYVCVRVCVKILWLVQNFKIVFKSANTIKYFEND